MERYMGLDAHASSCAVATVGPGELRSGARVFWSVFLIQGAAAHPERSPRAREMSCQAKAVNPPSS